jgi:hypothetical protein
MALSEVAEEANSNRPQTRAPKIGGQEDLSSGRLEMKESFKLHDARRVWP